MHICGDEIMAMVMAVPMLGYCLKCLKAKLTRLKKGVR